MLPKIAIEVDEESARAAGLSLTDVAYQLDGATEGSMGGSVIEATEEMPVRVRLDDSRRADFSNLSSLDIVNPRATSADGEFYQGVPMSAIGEFKLTSEFGAIQHLNGVCVNELQAFIPAGVLPSTVLTNFQNRLAEANFEMPSGYSLRFGGEAAKRDGAVGNLMANVGILMVLMVATLVLSFGSFRIASVVGFVGMLSIGLGLGALWIFGFPFGFMAIVGAMGFQPAYLPKTRHSREYAEMESRRGCCPWR